MCTEGQRQSTGRNSQRRMRHRSVAPWGSEKWTVKKMAGRSVFMARAAIASTLFSMMPRWKLFVCHTFYSIPWRCDVFLLVVVVVLDFSYTFWLICLSRIAWEQNIYSSAYKFTTLSDNRLMILATFAFISIYGVFTYEKEELLSKQRSWNIVFCAMF